MTELDALATKRRYGLWAARAVVRVSLRIAASGGEREAPWALPDPQGGHAVAGTDDVESQFDPGVPLQFWVLRQEAAA
jgi:hypothetical protein